MTKTESTPSSLTEERDRERAKALASGDPRAIRESYGFTLQDVAATIGISIQHLSAVERGTMDASNQVLDRLAEALGVPRRNLYRSVRGKLYERKQREFEAKMEAKRQELETLPEGA